MINEIFKNKFPFVANYFTAYFESKKRFPQSIVFEGQNTLSQYFFSLELLRILNCEKKEENCSCTNCNWIKENSHPAIINVTPIDFKDDSSKTVISVKQIEKIMAVINETSSYHRFFIFSNAKIEQCTQSKKNELEEYKNFGFDLKKENWLPYPVNRKIMQEEASNALLKLTEEAPQKVTFIFLVNSKEDVIQTILSRSLVFRLSLQEKQELYDFSECFKNYPNMKIKDGMEGAILFLDKISKEEIDPICALNSVQDFLIKKAKNNVQMVTCDIKRVELAKKQINALVSLKCAIEGLFLDLSYGEENE